MKKLLVSPDVAFVDSVLNLEKNNTHGKEDLHTYTQTFNDRSGTPLWLHTTMFYYRTYNELGGFYQFLATPLPEVIQNGKGINHL